MAGLTEVPVTVMELDDEKAAQVAIIENVQRENLNPMEEASAYKRLTTEYKMTQEELSRKIGKSRSAIANTMRLLDLPEAVCELVKAGRLSAGHARTLLSLKDPSKMLPTANRIMSKNLSVRESELLVRKLNKSDSSNGSEKNDELVVDYTAELAKKMTSRIGHRVTIVKKGGLKRVEIHFSDDKELDDIVARLCGENIFDE